MYATCRKCFEWLFTTLLPGCQFFKDFPDVEETAGNMETAFPLAAFQWEKHFALAIEVTIPLGVFGVAEVRPGIVVNTL